MHEFASLPTSAGGLPVIYSSVSNQVTTHDSTEFVFSNGGYYLGPSSGQTSQQTYIYTDSQGHCYDRTLTAANLALTKVENEQGCLH